MLVAFRGREEKKRPFIRWMVWGTGKLRSRKQDVFINMMVLGFIDALFRFSFRIGIRGDENCVFTFISLTRIYS